LVIPDIHISDYTYDLPEERIAVYPLSEREQSRLLLWKEGQISETLFSHVDRVIPANSLLVFNNTRVIHARLIFRTPSGARIEIFCLEPRQPAGYQLSFQSTESVEWKCLVGNARKWKRGSLVLPVAVGEVTVTFRAEMTGRVGNAFLVRFSWEPPVTFATLIEAAGSMPIPPYLNRDAETIDDDRYQTTYARIDGSVAAPTAGLHFTPRVMENLKNKGTSFAELTLHIGAGTFQPVKSERVADHDMHTETVYVTRDFLEKLHHHAGRVIAVGTTSVRSLESLYWLGAALANPDSGILTAMVQNPALDDKAGSRHLPSFHVGQWQPYLTGSALIPEEATARLLTLMQEKGLGQLSFTTAIIILPGYPFRLVNGMFTNFHQPRSTLLLLIAAFLGHDWKKVYDYALQQGFRFLSYGDANLFLKF